MFELVVSRSGKLALNRATYQSKNIGWGRIVIILISLMLNGYMMFSLFEETDEGKKFEGTWELISLEIGGTRLTEKDVAAFGLKLTFVDNRCKGQWANGQKAAGSFAWDAT